MRSLITKILTIVLTFLALLGVAFLFYSIFTTENYKRLRLEGIEKTVEFETEKVNKTIAEIERGAIWFAQGAFLCYEDHSEELGEKLILDYLKSFPTPIGAGFWYAPYAHDESKLRAGVYGFYDAQIGGVRPDETFFADEYDYHNMSWYKEIAREAKTPNQVVWTSPYIDDSGTHSLMTTAGAGIFDEEGTLIAMSTIDWRIEEIISDLSEIKPTDGSFVLLCAPENDYIISNTYDNAGSPGASLKTLPWDIRDVSFELSGVTYRVFSRIMDNGWLLSVQIPTGEIFEEIETRNFRFSLIIAASSLSMLVAAFLLISSQIAKPLKRLTDDVALLGLGNLGVSVDVRTNDELGVLAQTFNRMAVDLKESIERSEREHAEKERIGTELNIAAKIQASMLPRIFPPYPDRPEFDLYAAMFPAKEVGGDFYDFFFIDENRLALVIADVSGKGVPAALFMVIAKTLIKNNAQAGKQPREVFEDVNDMLCENNDALMFVTAFMGILDIKGGIFTYVNAGHNPPLLRRAGGSYELLKCKSGFVLAGLEGIAYTQAEISLYPGDTIFMYTDGLTEAANRDDELFTGSGLLLTANKHKDRDPKEFLLHIKSEIESFADGAEQADDITMLVMRISGGRDDRIKHRS